MCANIMYKEWMEVYVRYDEDEECTWNVFLANTMGWSALKYYQIEPRSKPWGFRKKPREAGMRY